MNWKLTRPDHPIRFEEDEPMCQIFPVNYAGIEKFEPRMAQLSESPELEKEFGAWADSRLAFHREMERSSPPNPGDRWQKLYYRGVTPDDQPASCPHKVKLRIKPFSGQKNRRMKALLSDAAGGPETLQLRDVSDPQPGQNELAGSRPRLLDQLPRRADHRGQVSVEAATAVRAGRRDRR